MLWTGALGFIPCALLGTFCAFRLARFNVKVSAVHGYFEGLPCPTTGVIVAAYVLSGIKIWNWLAMLCVLALAFLMVSEIHYPDNKGASADQLHLPGILLDLHDYLLACMGSRSLRSLHYFRYCQYIPQPSQG